MEKLRKRKSKMNNLTANQIIKAVKLKGYTVFEDDSKPLNLNIIGIRAADGKVNTFDDMLTVVWKYRGSWSMAAFPCTTDPGLYWLKNYPESLVGTAILKEGQYKGSHEIGKHKGVYTALTQKDGVTVIRDADRDKELDYSNGIEDKGIFGINIHRASSKHESIQVDRWSAGCVVIADPHCYDVFIKMCEESAEVWSNSFSLTLLNENDLN